MEWNDIIKKEEQKEYYQNLMSFIDYEYQNKQIYPPYQDIYKAFDLTPFNQVKVVIIGQDPYPTEGVANGLAFSVNDNIKVPKSLINIFKELHNELDIKIPSNGNLSKWAEKGIFLINRILTVESGKPLSHKNKGWEIFVNEIIDNLNKNDQKMVFILLGNEAKKYQSMLDNPHHLVLSTSHPSPLGAYQGFFGSGIFKKTIEYLNVDKSFWEL